MAVDQQTIRLSGITGFLTRKPIILQLLRFAAIGVINTALDFIILNVVSKSLGIASGSRLGEINVIGFSLAVIQSYFWNRYWAFSKDRLVDVRNYIIRPILVGALGAGAVAAVLFGSSVSASAGFYVMVFGMFILLELVFWLAFGLGKLALPRQPVEEFTAFLVVSLIGLGINSLLIGTISSGLHLAAGSDLNKNLAKIIATLVSLVWNFVGYKVFVFKK